VDAVKPPKDRTLTRPGKKDELDAQAVQLAHDEVVKLLAEGLGRGIFHNGVLIKKAGMTTAGSPYDVFHGLGRVPEISFPVRQTANTGWWVAPHPTDPRNRILLSISTGTTSDVTWLIA
jgi:hypothetical protein